MTLTIAARFNGPPDSGNGGYVAGRLAEQALSRAHQPPVGRGAPWVEVTLRSPPPLDVAMDLRPGSGQPDEPNGALTAYHGDTVVAVARLLAQAPDQAAVVPPVPLDEAQRAQGNYLGLTDHPFPTCWVCGPSRPQHDGYDLRPGPVGDDRTACTWEVDDVVAGADGTAGVAAAWAALDCPGAWTALQGETVMVLGRIAAHLDALPSTGQACVVMGRLLGRDGRKSFTATTLYGPDGSPLAQALATWITIG